MSKTLYSLLLYLGKALVWTMLPAVITGKRENKRLKSRKRAKQELPECEYGKKASAFHSYDECDGRSFVRM